MPLEATAWIVAVEKYAAGSDLSLKQPVGAWALDFAELMLRRGVGRIVLSASLNDLPEYKVRLAALEQNAADGKFDFLRTGAAQGDIPNALDMIRGKGTLLIYWIGHGIMARTRGQPSRGFLCADSKSISDLRIIDVDSLITKLRSAEYPAVQLGFLECCAQVVSGAPAALNLGGDGRTARRQFFYHAASAGETASGSTAKAGFSLTVLQALESSDSFPPDPPDVFFDALKKSLGSIPLQTRPVLQRTEESGEIWSNGDPGRLDEVFDAALVAGLEQSQFDLLWQSIRTAEGVKPIELARAYSDDNLARFSADLHARQPMVSAPDLLKKAAGRLSLQLEFEAPSRRLRLLFRDWITIYEKILGDEMLGDPGRLQDLPQLMLSTLAQSKAERGLKLFLKVMETAARQARRGSRAAADALSEALRKHPLLVPLYEEAMEEIGDEDEPVYLLLELECAPAPQVANVIKAWLYPGATGGHDPRPVWNEGPLAQQINRAVQKALEEFPEHPLLVELLAPNQLLCTPSELLKFKDPLLPISMWLEQEYPITFRWSDRMKDDDRERFYRGNWMRASGKTRRVVERAESLSCAWLPAETGSGRGCHVVGLSFPGPSPAEPGRNQQDFFMALKAGAPYMCWPRDPPGNLESFQKAVGELLGRSKLKNLPATLVEGKADMALRDLLADLIVLIDEPGRNPYNNETNLVDTPQRGEA